jgi:hypothetical protein
MAAVADGTIFFLPSPDHFATHQDTANLQEKSSMWEMSQ